MTNFYKKQNIQPGWELSTLRDLVMIKKGEQLNKLAMDVSGEYPALNGGINPSGYTDKWNTNENTITISEGGNSCGFVNFNKEKFWCGGHCYALLNPKENIDNNFLYQALKSEQDRLMKLRVGSGLPNIQKRSIEEFPLLIPKSKNEQKKIAEILSVVDDEIQKTEKIIFQTEKLKKGLMKDLFTKGIGHTKFKKTQIGSIPEEWEIVSLKDISINLDNKRIPVTKSERDPGPYPYYGATGIVGYVSGYIFDEDLLLISEDGANLKDRNYPIAFTAKGKYWVNNHAHIQKFENKHLQKYVQDYFNFINLDPYLTGMAQPKLNKDRLFSIPIPKPKDLNEVQKISQILNAIDEKIFASKNFKEKIGELKKGLMSDLLSGKIRTVNG